MFSSFIFKLSLQNAPLKSSYFMVFSIPPYILHLSFYSEAEIGTEVIAK